MEYWEKNGDEEANENQRSQVSFGRCSPQFPVRQSGETQRHQAWEVELWKGLTAEPWATECILYRCAMRDRTVLVQIEVCEEEEKDGESLVGGIKRNVVLAAKGRREKWREKGRQKEGGMGKSGLSSVAIWPLHWSRTLTPSSWGWREEGEQNHSCETLSSVIKKKKKSNIHIPIESHTSFIS